MNANEAREHFLGLPEAWEDFPFGPEVSVFKIAKKMFGTLGYEDDLARINLKCDPELALTLRDVFPAVMPGYHMNKTHWNTVLLDASVPVAELERMIEHSYALVVAGLPRADRDALLRRHGRDAVFR